MGRTGWIAVGALAVVVIGASVAYRISVLKSPAQPDAIPMAIASRTQKLAATIICRRPGVRLMPRRGVPGLERLASSTRDAACESTQPCWVTSMMCFSPASASRRGFTGSDGKFMVSTDGPDGAIHDYQVKFTFGVSPLQQYLIEFPGGRLQALGIAWDSRPRSQGGRAMVRSLSRADCYLSQCSALDRDRSKLEFHVRRLSFHQRAQELRSPHADVCNHLC